MDDVTELHNLLKTAMTLAETAKVSPFLVYLIAMAAKETENQIAEAVRSDASDANKGFSDGH